MEPIDDLVWNSEVPIKNIGIRRFRMEPIDNIGIRRFWMEPIDDIGIRRFWMEVMEPIDDLEFRGSGWKSWNLSIILKFGGSGC
ncbi:hypothetical protein GLOIN_2v1786845 [Rhizophagus irregularis DAOM 181602=DAOM 197198]|uniref:Uncharacterized protein n=1 Tax=Rhizophagus irregularis (strain DAOM 181602 / DAOM 197198 / MUCL 43194) TaxID=747089 RepID=A0A2P4P7B5_RHIID|nr:hypothetical protein GLOIN_2v1786845 [Rhizophagus irregularis DAOM 181602=DAOM 197198]POG61282.1 hypothetical protein GLOIN_2v1786845 [Rhizophagus irregularis DAOM 181602=DAOM 197198]|eukprot:XP_025168148.1 hypothetical protein GLOIN_2v1786845 [Rhizophagus irregularis DAOM 181602=DAOM 197198]